MKTYLNSTWAKLMAVTFLLGAVSLPAADTGTPSQTPDANVSSNSTMSDAQMAQKLDKLANGNENTQQSLDEQLKHIEDFYTSLQSKPETYIPNRVVAQAKGVLIFSYWSVAAGADVTGSRAIGLKKTKIDDFSGPVFYTLAGPGSGYPASGERTYAIAFLNTDNALRALTNVTFSWNGTVTVAAGSHAEKASADEQPADIFIYQKSDSPNIKATVAGFTISLDTGSTRIFYKLPDVNIYDIFTDKVLAPGLSNIAIINSLNNQAKGTVPMIPPDPYSGATRPVVSPGDVINNDQSPPPNVNGPTKP